ncbi:single-stranded DNA-binding protein [Streptomyces sp. NBC_01550]|uniref:single-stranded DNA-binding protein n=1 Tax=unclassified Streptomyces TaxID=2593676 RepID=UPI003870054A|nr:single-stranded DNA-binding protein [Streptomyces sp. NBC_01620]
MNDTVVTLVGNAATGVEFRETATGGMARFRFAVTARRWDREKQFWTDGHTSFYTVWAWRTLASNLAGSVAVGEPLVVHGRLKVREEERDGQRRTFVDIEALAVGHDLTRGTAAFRRVVRGDPTLTAGPGRRGGPAEEGEEKSDGFGGPVERREPVVRSAKRAQGERRVQSERGARRGQRGQTVRQEQIPELASAL